MPGAGPRAPLVGTHCRTPPGCSGRCARPASGPGIRRGYRPSDLRIVDVAPTLLYLLRESIPDDMDGRVRTEIFEDEFVLGNEPRYHSAADTDIPGDGPGLTDSREDEELRRRLKSLGYIE